MSDIYGLPDTYGRQEGDTWTTVLPDGRIVVNTIPIGNGNQTVDQVITNPDGSTTSSRVVDNGAGGWQRWNDDSTGTASYAGKDGQGAEVYGQHFNPGASTAGQASHEFGMSTNYNNTYTASYDENGNRVGTDVGVANKGGLYDNIHVDNYGNKTFSATTRDESGGLVSTFTGQVDSDGNGWRDISGKDGPQRWQVSSDSQGKTVLSRTEETDSGVHHFRMDEDGTLTDEFRGNEPGDWYRDTIATDANGKTTVTRLDVHLGVTVFDTDGNIVSRQRPEDKRSGFEKVVDTTGEFVIDTAYGAGRMAFGLTNLGAVYNAVSPLWGQHDAAVTADDVIGETVESFKPLFTGNGHERSQALQTLVTGTNTDEYAEDSTVSTTKAVLTAATMFIPGPKGTGLFRRGGRAGEEHLIREMGAAGKSEPEIIAALKELRAVDEMVPWQQGSRLDAPEVVAAIESSRLSRGEDAAGASGLGEVPEQQPWHTPGVKAPVAVAPRAIPPVRGPGLLSNPLARFDESGLPIGMLENPIIHLGGPNPGRPGDIIPRRSPGQHGNGGGAAARAPGLRKPSGNPESKSYVDDQMSLYDTTNGAKGRRQTLSKEAAEEIDAQLSTIELERDRFASLKESELTLYGELHIKEVADGLGIKLGRGGPLKRLIKRRDLDEILEDLKDSGASDADRKQLRESVETRIDSYIALTDEKTELGMIGARDALPARASAKS